LQRYDYLYGQVAQNNGGVDKSKIIGRSGASTGVINGSSTKSWEQRFSYDDTVDYQLPRNTHQGTGSTSSWKQEFIYDRYGNRVQSGSSTHFGADFTPVVSTDISVSTNRFISSGAIPITFDAVGNITQDVSPRNGFEYSAGNNEELRIACMAVVLILIGVTSASACYCGRPLVEKLFDNRRPFLWVTWLRSAARKKWSWTTRPEVSIRSGFLSGNYGKG
jgi:hypothetical protein